MTTMWQFGLSTLFVARIGLICLVTSGILLFNLPSDASAGFYVRGVGRTTAGVNQYGNHFTLDLSKDTGQLEQGFVHLNLEATREAFGAIASADLSGGAAIGNLSGGSYSLARVTLVGNNIFTASSTANTTLLWMDTITVSRPGAPSGTLVDVRFSLSFTSHTDAAGSGGASAQAAYYFNDSSLTSALNLFGEPPTYAGDKIRRLYVNTPYSVLGSLNLFASSTANDRIPNSSAEANALYTAHFYIDPLTAGDTIVSDSGHNFLTPQAVPEPSSLALLGMGAAVFAGYIGWRRRKHACIGAV